MPDTDSIVIAKSFNYRGSAEIWTNKYHLEGSTPASQADALALLRAIWDSEKPAFGQGVTLAGGSFYRAGNDAAAYMFTTANIGGTTTTNRGSNVNSGDSAPGDAAVWVRWGTDQRNTKNKPIYLRKYFHGVPLQSADGDLVEATARTALLAHGAKMYDGTLPGGMKICGPQGADALNHGVAQYSTTRTLKRNARTPI